MRRLHTRELRVATRKTPRAINRQIVLNLLRSHQPISRAELARLLGIQRSAVGRIVNELIDQGLVREGATGAADRGRKPTLLHLDSRGRCAVAVDVRVTRTYVAVTDLVGREISQVESFATDREPKDFVRHLAAEVRAMLDAHPEAGRCQGVGVAFPGMLDRSGSVVVHAPALGWRDVPLKEPLAAALGLPLEMENAAKACALAQIWDARGAAPPGDMVFVSVSDGVGVGVVVGGEVLRGRHNVAGEVGHLPLNIDGPRCACGATGCWEAYVSNLATLSRYAGHPVQPRQPAAAEAVQLTVEDLVGRARDGDVKAITALLATARYLGLGLASIVNTFDPARIYVGGEISAAWDLIEAAVRAALAERMLVASAADTDIVVVAPQEHPRLRGASALVGALVFAAEHVA
ncbi:MAG TPA: ROK family transcriptional regulator [Vicinamibacteria bacterium]